MNLTVLGLRVEHAEASPLDVGTPLPRLSWRTETDIDGWLQAAWEVEVVDDAGQPIWRSGEQAGRESRLIRFGGPALRSRQRCRWRVRVWGVDGSASDWSEPAVFEIALLAPDDWQAEVITAGVCAWEAADGPTPPTYLRTRFDLAVGITSARLHCTALGVYEATLNGSRIGDHALAPGWTAYRHRLHVQTFDVSDLLAVGSNVLEAVVADGWYCGSLGFSGNRNVYGDRTGFLAQLEIHLADGTERVVATDGSWEATTGPLLAADLYDGEHHDARVTTGPWRPVEVLPFDRRVLEPQASPPVRVTEVVAPVAITRSPSGRTIVDFGQNLVGVIRLRVQGPAGTTVTLRHAEVLEDGELCTRILRGAEATDRYTLAGSGIETWHPRFTSHGFRYAEVSGWPGELGPEDIDALVLHSDMPRTGWLTTSSDLVNRLHENIVWGWRGNSVSLPTDCPQRDERLGWTGDIQVFASTASFLYDTAGFLGSWLADLAAEQLPDGRVPPVVPDVLGDTMPIYGAGWGDAATVVPTVLHDWYGDAGILERQLPSMVGWVSSIRNRARDGVLWSGDLQWGDWVDPTVDPNTPASARTDADFVATAFFAHSADLVASAAEVLGDADAAAEHHDLAERIRKAMRELWVSPAGRVVADTQTGCSLALMFDLVDEAHRDVVGARLRALVRNERYRVATGFLGTPLLLPALTAAGRVGDAYRMLLQTDSPSWLYAVTMGATSIWERWDALRPDGRLNAGEGMLSFNHYALGAVGAWLHETIGGLAMVEPGFRRFRVAPRPARGITSASLVFDSPYGRIAIAWSLAGRGIELRVQVPPNTTAEIHPPARSGGPITVGGGHHHLRYAIDEATYRRWVPPYSLSTPVRELAADPAAWDLVRQHLPDLVGRVDETTDLPLEDPTINRGAPGDVMLALLGALQSASPIPPPPEEIFLARASSADDTP